jgi:non-ribosomal peptide synthetase component F
VAKTLPMSRFIQNYNQHLTEAERIDDVLVLEQRAGRPAWVLETEERARTTAQATEFLSAALAALVRDETVVDRFAEALAGALPWVAFLPERDREVFVTEAADTLRACASIGRYTAFADLIEDWRTTAEVWSDPARAAALSGDITEPLDRPV